MRLLSSIALLALASTASASLFAATANHKGGGQSPTPVAGVYAITFNIDLATTLPAGSTLVCKAQIVPSVSGQEGFNYQTNAVPVESAASAATISGSTATCSVAIPFAWSINNPQSGAQLSYELDAVNAAGTLPAVVRTSIQQGIAEPYPATGNTANLTFAVTF